MTEVGTVYGRALYDLANSEGLADVIMQQLDILRQSFGSEPDFLRLLGCPNLSKQEKCDLLTETFGQAVHAYVLNFLKILTEKNYARHFSDCCDAYVNCYNADHNILPVTAVTAVTLTAAQADKLREKLCALTGKQVSLSNRVDPRVLGGVRLDYDGKQLDDTVAHRLASIRTMLGSTVL